MNKTRKKTVAVGMSGGVDSSVSAALLKYQGFRVIGVFMEIFSDSVLKSVVGRSACFGPEEEDDLRDARKVAETLNIPLLTVDLKKEYRLDILDYVKREYCRGNTPNPCVKCNKELKFEAITDRLNRKGIRFDFFATGHYARIEYDRAGGRFILRKAADLKKDQSYFLYHLKDYQLERTLFPLGQYEKSEIRNMAREFNLGVSEKKESQDFIAGGYQQLFEDRNPGHVVNSNGKIMGKHRGILFYTIGQRRGIGVSGKEPLYVIKKDPAKNTIMVGTRTELLGNKLIADQLSWINFDRLTTPMTARARIRYHHQEARATVIPRSPHQVTVEFEEPQSAITPGQAIVFYDRDRVIGGGIISRQVS